MVITPGKRALFIIVYIGISIFKTVIFVPKGTCKYIPSCSDYAKEAIEQLPFWHAIIKITYRVLRCNPLIKGGFDPVIHTTRKV